MKLIMKTIKGLKKLKSISRKALIDALQGKYVTLVGTCHIPYFTGDDEATRDEKVAIQLRMLEGQIEKCREKNYKYKYAKLFEKTSQGYKRGNSHHSWQKGDYCLTYLGYYVVVTGHVMLLLTTV